MKLVYFNTCSTLEEAKQLYKSLAKKHHPDKGGSEEVMKQINNEYEIICARLVSKLDMDEESRNKEFMDSQLYREKLNQLLDLSDIHIELIGTWLWITGETFKIKDKLKELEFNWASTKKAWFWRPDSEKSSNRRSMTLDAIRSKYGTTLIMNDRLIALNH